LKIDNAIELLAADTALAPSRAQTTLHASESYFACFDWQLSYLHANALCHRPALTRYRVDISGTSSSRDPRGLALGAWSRRSIDRFADA
jgi:hypothetical protein